MTVDHVEPSHLDKHARQSFSIGMVAREYNHDYHNRNSLNDTVLMCLTEEQLTLQVIISKRRITFIHLYLVFSVETSFICKLTQP